MGFIRFQAAFLHCLSFARAGVSPPTTSRDGAVYIGYCGGFCATKTGSAALPILARCSILLRFAPCIACFLTQNPFRKPKINSPAPAPRVVLTIRSKVSGCLKRKKTAVHTQPFLPTSLFFLNNFRQNHANHKRHRRRQNLAQPVGIQRQIDFQHTV